MRPTLRHGRRRRPFLRAARKICNLRNRMNAKEARPTAVLDAPNASSTLAYLRPYVSGEAFTPTCQSQW